MNVWNEPYGCACYHPLFVFNQLGDLERRALLAGVGRHARKLGLARFRTDAPSCGNLWKL